MSLYSYRIFQTVVQYQSFARAAEASNLTPSAVSHMIAGLEEQFGVTLFIRGKKTVSLTESGKQIYQYVKDILITEDMLDRRVAQIKGAQTGPVRLGMIESVTVNWLSGILSQYRALCPGVSVEIVECGYSSLIHDVLSHDLDIAVVSHTSVRENTSLPLQFIPLYDDRIVCVLPRSSALASRDFISIEELSEIQVIIPQGGDEADVKQYLIKHDVHPKIVGSSASCVPLLEMVKCGIGFGLTPELSVTHFGYEEEFLVHPVVPFEARTLGIITQEPRFLSPAVQRMVEAIQKYVTEYFSIS